jgi:hypothetical protein
MRRRLRPTPASSGRSRKRTRRWWLRGIVKCAQGYASGFNGGAYSFSESFCHGYDRERGYIKRHAENERKRLELVAAREAKDKAYWDERARWNQRELDLGCIGDSPRMGTPSLSDCPDYLKSFLDPAVPYDAAIRKAADQQNKVATKKPAPQRAR